MMKSKAALCGRDSSEIAEHISKMAEQEKQREKTVTSRSLEGWLVQPAAQCVETWLKQNNHADIRHHTAFIAAWRQVHHKLVACSDIEKEKRSAYTCSASLADVVFWMSESIFEHIPFAVPTVPVALLSCATQGEPPAVPSFLDFLCHPEVP